MNKDNLILFRLSLGDLAAARCLYREGLYRQSLFMFQQASEKANKGFAVLAGEVHETKVRKYSHRQLSIYNDITRKKKEEIAKIRQAIEAFPHTQSFVLPMLDFEAHQNLMEIASQELSQWEQNKKHGFSVRELNVLISEIKESEAFEFIKSRNIKAQLKKHCSVLANWVGKFATPQGFAYQNELQETVNNKKKLQELTDSVFKLSVLQIQLVFSQFTLIACALITNNHSTSTRYSDDNIDPDEVYTLKLPIIRKQEIFMNMLEQAINRITNILQNKSETQ